MNIMTLSIALSGAAFLVFLVTYLVVKSREFVWKSSAGGVVSSEIRLNDKVATAEVIGILRSWLSDHGFSEEEIRWDLFVRRLSPGLPKTTDGEIVHPKVFMRRAADSNTVMAWGLSEPTLRSPRISVFYFHELWQPRSGIFTTKPEVDLEPLAKEFWAFINREIRPRYEGLGRIS